MVSIALIFIINLVCGEAIADELTVDEPVSTSENDTGPESQAGDVDQAPRPIVIYIQQSRPSNNLPVQPSQQQPPYQPPQPYQQLPYKPHHGYNPPQLPYYQPRQPAQPPPVPNIQIYY